MAFKISVQIWKGAAVILQWHIVGGFFDARSMLELFNSIENGEFWI